MLQMTRFAKMLLLVSSALLPVTGSAGEGRDLALVGSAAARRADGQLLMAQKAKLRAKPHPKPKIIYRTISNTKAYDAASRGPHVNIKVTPPKMQGPDEFVYVEVYNFTKQDLANIEFEITLQNSQGYDLTTKINAGALNAYKSGMNSGLRKIPTPGKGPFPPIRSVRIDNLDVVNADATVMTFPTYVDLVRTK